MEHVSLARDGDGEAYPQEFSLGGNRYIALWPQRIYEQQGFEESSPVAVISARDIRKVSLQWIQALVDRYTADDVFHEAFLQGILFTHTGNEKNGEFEITQDAEDFLRAKGTKHLSTCFIERNGDPPPAGPYFYIKKSLRPAWKLCEDSHSAFLQTLIPGPNGDPCKLRTAGDTPGNVTLAVPSRLQTTLSSNGSPPRVLEGWRIAVKDNFQFKGVKMSACNKAYYDWSEPAPATAAAIQILYDAGAVIVGTTRLASFAATEEPVECIDWQAPWNPRADGYQSPAGSSSGSGAAIATYPWLDIAIGSDTSGSGRRPGHWNGAFAMRPTHGLLSHDGFLASFPRFDTPTFFGRELDKCRHFAAAWYGKEVPSLPQQETNAVSIIYALDYMNDIKNSDQMKVIDAFVADLESSLGMTRERLSFDQAWEETPPAEANGATLQGYMKDVSRDSFFYEDYHNFDQFRQGYRQAYGKEPYVSPPVRWQWELSSRITEEAHAQATTRLEVYKTWFLDVVMKAHDRTALVIIPIEEISPRYRDEMPTSHFNPVGVPNLFLSPILGAPELTIPIGEFAYRSKVSGREEKLPIGISIIGLPGHDMELFDIAKDCLLKAGRPTHVLAGNTLFPPAL